MIRTLSIIMKYYQWLCSVLINYIPFLATTDWSFCFIFSSVTQRLPTEADLSCNAPVEAFISCMSQFSKKQKLNVV